MKINLKSGLVSILAVMLIIIVVFIIQKSKDANNTEQAKDITLYENEYFLSFEYTNFFGNLANFEDRTKKCIYEPAKPENVDIDGDGIHEILVFCLRGGSISGKDLYVFDVAKEGLVYTDKLDTEGGGSIEDCNNDGVEDIKTIKRADGVWDCEKEQCMDGDRWLNVEFCNSWDRPRQKIVTNKIGVK